MLLCIDAGNTQIHGGFYRNRNEVIHFRINTKIGWSADQLGIFLTSFCREKEIDVSKVGQVAVSSVVPSLDYHLNNASLKYFKCQPIFVKAGIKTGINVNKFKNYNEIGADLICSAVGAVYKYKDSNLMIVDMGTATTITAINKAKEFLTGAIFPGLATQISSLASSAEKLFSVELAKPKNEAPKSTVEAIQTGVYYSHLGGVGLLIKKLAKECFGSEEYLVVGTGGYARLFKEEKLFDYFESDLVLAGLLKIMDFNS